MMGGSTRRNVFELVSALRLKSSKKKKKERGKKAASCREGETK